MLVESCQAPGRSFQHARAFLTLIILPIGTVSGYLLKILTTSLVKEYRKLTGHNLLYSNSNFALILHMLFGPYITT